MIFWVIIFIHCNLSDLKHLILTEIAKSILAPSTINGNLHNLTITLNKQSN